MRAGPNQPNPSRETKWNGERESALHLCLWPCLILGCVQAGQAEQPGVGWALGSVEPRGPGSCAAGVGVLGYLVPPAGLGSFFLPSLNVQLLLLQCMAVLVSLGFWGPVCPSFPAPQSTVLPFPCPRPRNLSLILCSSHPGEGMAGVGGWGGTTSPVSPRERALPDLHSCLRGASPGPCGPGTAKLRAVPSCCGDLVPGGGDGALGPGEHLPACAGPSAAPRLLRWLSGAADKAFALSCPYCCIKWLDSKTKRKNYMMCGKRQGGKNTTWRFLQPRPWGERGAQTPRDRLGLDQAQWWGGRPGIPPAPGSPPPLPCLLWKWLVAGGAESGAGGEGQEGAGRAGCPQPGHQWAPCWGTTTLSWPLKRSSTEQSHWKARSSCVAAPSPHSQSEDGGC